MLNKLRKVDIKNVADNKKTKKKVVKKSLAVFVASILCLNSAAAFHMASATKTDTNTNFGERLAYYNNSDHLTQTRLMMDGNNFLKDGFWMRAKLTALDGDVSTPATKYSATIEFTIPGYDLANLRFFVFDKNFSRKGKVSQHVIEKPQGETAEINLTNLTQSTYEVHVYDGALDSNRFVCKAEFCVTNNDMTAGSGVSATANLLDSDGNQIQINGSPVNLTYFKKHDKSGEAQSCFELPSNMVPYNAKTVKVVFFATKRDNGEGVNIDQTLYDYVWAKASGSSATPGTIFYYPEASWGTGESINYEAHFYKDEVLKENFICKATGIKI